MVTISDTSAIRLHPLERQVLDKVLASTDRELSVSDLKILKIQLRHAIILSREMTGHGFYTRFSVAESALRLPNHRGGERRSPRIESRCGFPTVHQRRRSKSA